MTRVNELGLPIGPALDGWQPLQRPPRRVLEGRWCRVEPLDPGRHAGELFAANSLDREGRMWTYLAYGPFGTLAAYREWLAPRAASADPLFFAVVDAASGEARGLGSYLRIEPETGSIEVGHLQFSPLLQQSTAATEAMYLMMRNVFELGYRRYDWKCDALNAASRRAAERLGFTFEGVFRHATVYKGRNRDTAWYSIIDSEWPALERGFREWLRPENFDASGRQRRPLELRAGRPVTRDRTGERIPAATVPVLVSQLLALLDSSARLTEQLPGDALAERVPGRDLAHIALAAHVPQIVIELLDAALAAQDTGGRIGREPPERARTAAEVAGLTRSVSQALAVWWGANQSRLPATVHTPAGAQPLQAVLARSTRHVAQHVRQLEWLLRRRGVAPQPALAAVLLEGLLLPEDVWDDEQVHP